MKCMYVCTCVQKPVRRGRLVQLQGSQVLHALHNLYIHVCNYILTYIHTLTLNYTHTYIHILIDLQASIHKYRCVYIHTYVHVYPNWLTQDSINKYRYTHTCIHTYIHTYNKIFICTNYGIHTVHTYIHVLYIHRAH